WLAGAAWREKNGDRGGRCSPGGRRSSREGVLSCLTVRLRHLQTALPGRRGQGHRPGRTGLRRPTVRKMMRALLCLLATTVLASPAWAEPTFLAKQYTRCTACHYSPTGGGLLTPYGRLLSHRELSTTGAAATAPVAGAQADPPAGIRK